MVDARPARRGLAVLGAAVLLAACGPTVVAGTVGGPFATTAPSPSTTASSPSPTSTGPTSPSPTPPSPTPTATVPPLSYDSISLNNSTLGFRSPGGSPPWVKTLAQGGYNVNRTFYDNAASGLHVTVEVDLPTHLTALEHARELDADKQTTEVGYRLLALGSGPLDGATWAFTSAKTPPTQYVIDWFCVYPAFGAAILVQGPVAAKALIKALWLEIVQSAYVPTPYSTPGVDAPSPVTPSPVTAPSVTSTD